MARLDICNQKWMLAGTNVQENSVKLMLVSSESCSRLKEGCLFPLQVPTVANCQSISVFFVCGSVIQPAHFLEMSTL